MPRMLTTDIENHSGPTVLHRSPQFRVTIDANTPFVCYMELLACYANKPLPFCVSICAGIAISCFHRIFVRAKSTFLRHVCPFVHSVHSRNISVARGAGG